MRNVMSYQKPELFLVGAAQGLVLGGVVIPATFHDHFNTRGCQITGSRNDATCP
jgi:hypothetical protein